MRQENNNVEISPRAGVDPPRDAAFLEGKVGLFSRRALIWKKGETSAFPMG